MMKKNLVFQFRRSWMTCFVFVTLLGSLNPVKSQTSRNDLKETLKISIGETVLPEQISIHKTDKFEWEIKNNRNEVIANQHSASLFAYSFAEPGNYFLDLRVSHAENDHVCSHQEHTGSWIIEVVPVRVIFDIERIKFSKPLTAENLMIGIEVSIPIEVSYFEDRQLDLDVASLKIQFQGVDCEVVALPVDTTLKLLSGKSIVVFKANGKVPKQSFIMIDFIDQNNKITTYYPTNVL
jgi:hypothetical protein